MVLALRMCAEESRVLFLWVVGVLLDRRLLCVVVFRVHWAPSLVGLSVVQAVVLDVGNYRVLQEVLDTFSATQGSPDPSGADVIGHPLGHWMDHVLQSGQHCQSLLRPVPSAARLVVGRRPKWKPTLCL